MHSTIVARVRGADAAGRVSYIAPVTVGVLLQLSHRPNMNLTQKYLEVGLQIQIYSTSARRNAAQRQ